MFPKTSYSSKTQNQATGPSHRFNNDIQKLMSYTDKLFNIMVQFPMPSNKYLYFKFRSNAVCEQRKRKVRYFQNYFEKNNTNMKMFSTSITSIVNVKIKTQFSNISHFLDNGINLFNKYFVNVGSNIDKLNNPNNLEITNYLFTRYNFSVNVSCTSLS